MIWTRSDGIRFSFTIRINEFNTNEIVLTNGGSFSDAQGIFQDGFDGSPDVDDLVAAFKQRVGFVGEVVWYTRLAGRVGLVDVDALDGAPEKDRFVVEGFATDGVVEDEDLGSAGTKTH